MALDSCDRCGRPHPRCHAHKNTLIDWQPCMKHPRTGGLVCDQHGGNSPGQVAKAAARRQAAAIESDAQALLGFDLSGSVGDAHAALDALAAMQLAIVEASARRVNAAMGMRYTNDRGDEQLRAEYAFMHQAIAQAHRILDTVAKHAPDSGATAAKNLLTSLAEKLDDLA